MDWTDLNALTEGCTWCCEVRHSPLMTETNEASSNSLSHRLPECHHWSSSSRCHRRHSDAQVQLPHWRQPPRDCLVSGENLDRSSAPTVSCVSLSNTTEMCKANSFSISQIDDTETRWRDAERLSNKAKNIEALCNYSQSNHLAKAAEPPAVLISHHRKGDHQGWIKNT